MHDMANPISHVTKLMFELVSLPNIDTKAATQNKKKKLLNYWVNLLPKRKDTKFVDNVTQSTK